MIKVLGQLMDRHGAARSIIAAAGAIAALQLAVMWVLTPSVRGVQMEGSMTMEQVLDADDVERTAVDIQRLSLRANSISRRIANDPESWQRPLEPSQAMAFGASMAAVEVPPDERDAFDEAVRMSDLADRALAELQLKSVMTGSRPLANISGTICSVGDTVNVSGMEVDMVVLEVQAGLVVLAHADAVDDPRMRRVLLLNGTRASGDLAWTPDNP